MAETTVPASSQMAVKTWGGGRTPPKKPKAPSGAKK